jgi:hypothetical protein
MNDYLIPGAATQRRSHLYRRGAPAAQAVPAEVASAASAPTLGADVKKGAKCNL